MNNRQKRLCRAILEFYDDSGAQPCPFAHLAKKTGYHPSDIYDKDSQSGDLWPFDAKARGSLAGLLAFTSGKHPTVSITPAGLAALENLCKDGSAAPLEPKKASFAAEYIPAEIIPAEPAPAAYIPPEAVPAEIVPAKIVPAPSLAPFPSDEVAAFVNEFKQWLKADPAGQTVLDGVQVYDLIEATLNEFRRESAKKKNR